MAMAAEEQAVYKQVGYSCTYLHVAISSSHASPNKFVVSVSPPIPIVFSLSSFSVSNRLVGCRCESRRWNLIPTNTVTVNPPCPIASLFCNRFHLCPSFSSLRSFLFTRIRIWLLRKLKTKKISFVSPLLYSQSRIARHCRPNSN